MKNFLSKLSFVIDNGIDRLGKNISWLTIVLTLLICIDVFLRYFLNSTETWIGELEWHLFSVIFLIGASYGLLHDKHVRVDIFYEKMNSTWQKRINVLGILLFLLPWSVVIIQTSWEYALNSWSFREASSQPNGLPARYIIKSFIWIGFGLLILQGLSLVVRDLVRKK